MGFGTTATERRGLENGGSAGFESFTVFVIIFTGGKSVEFSDINCDYKSELTLKNVNCKYVSLLLSSLPSS